jgi:hypothetical protein
VSEFFEWFRTKYGADFPVRLPRPLVKHDERVFITENLVGQLQHPPMVPEFRPEAEYSIAGEWGRGVNTYAFYWVDRRGEHRRFFRIFSGGVYGRPAEDMRAVVEYLAGYERWRERFEHALASSTLVCNMGDNTAEVVTSSGARLSHAGDEEGGAWWDALAQRMP